MCDKNCADCGCGTKTFASQIINLNPEEGKLFFHETSTIRVQNTLDGKDQHLRFHVKENILPTVSLTVSPAAAEVGQLINALFTAAIVTGSNNIASRSISPEDYTEAPETLDNSFTFLVNNLSRNESGALGLHTLTVTDDNDGSKSDTANIWVQYKYFIIFSVNKILTSTELQAAFTNNNGELASSARDIFGSEREYILPALSAGQKHYIHWLYPVSDTVGIGQPRTDAGIPIPVKVEAEPLLVINTHGLELTYMDARSLNSYGPITFKIKL